MTDTDKNQVGTFIAQCRKEKKLTQKQSGEKLNVTDRAVSKWETGRSFPDVSLMEPLCQELDISVSELLAGKRLEPEQYQKETEKMLMASVSAGQLMGLAGGALCHYPGNLCFSRFSICYKKNQRPPPGELYQHCLLDPGSGPDLQPRTTWTKIAGKKIPHLECNTGADRGCRDFLRNHGSKLCGQRWSVLHKRHESRGKNLWSGYFCSWSCHCGGNPGESWRRHGKKSGRWSRRKMPPKGITLFPAFIEKKKNSRNSIE